MAEKWNRRSIIADIEGLIEAGILKPGDKLPTREKLQARYGVGKTTIDGVIDIMQAQGTLWGVRGGRVYVAGAPEADDTGQLPPVSDE